MKGKYIKGDIINLCILSFMYIAVILCIVGFTNLYGSTMDWDSQHWVIPEYLRNRFYETGQLFPSFAFEAGGGQNIYYYAYYGLHSPFLYISYLLPFISMRTYIIAINILGVFASVWLFYIWIRGKYSQKVSLFTSILFLTSSPLIFHSHRHIMFVDYMPFLILALIFVRRYFKKKSSICPVIITALMIVTTSFFFSVGSFLVIGIYAIMLYLEDNEKINLWDMIKSISPIVGGVIVGIMIAGILLIPAMLGLLSGRTPSASSGAGGFDWGLLAPDVRADFLFFGSYSMGLSSFSCYAIVSALMKKKKSCRFLAVIISIICIFPIVVYMMNGGLYLDGKVLIPFLPLSMIVTAEFFKSLFLKDKIIKSVLMAGTIINVLLLFSGLNGNEKLALLVETIPILLGFIVYYKKPLSYAVCIPVAITSFLVCIVINLNDNMAVKSYEDDRSYETVKKFAKDIIAEEDDVYRFGNRCNRWSTANRIVTGGYYQTTIYSSVSNSCYKDFYLNQMRNEVSHRNSAGLTTSGNVLFNIYMGVKYYITESAYIPEGYRQIGAENNIYLYKSDDVFPIGYAETNVMSEKEYEKLEYPYNVEALMKYGIAEDKESSVESNYNGDTSIKEIPLQFSVEGDTEGINKTENGYSINLSKTKQLFLKLNEPMEGKLLFIRFDVNNDINGKSKDVYVTINNIKNKLTKKDWKYHNGNYSFEYVISSNEELEALDIVFSGGAYDISNIKCYTMDYKEIKNIRESIDEFVIDKDKTMADIIEGDINVSGDGRFHLSVPYDKGFTIFVDGKQVEYFRSDVDFIGFDIEKGTHHIKIKYTAPGFEAGKIMTMLGTAVFLIIAATECAMYIKKQKRAKRDESINKKI